jgi:hypothetical protein
MVVALILLAVASWGWVTAIREEKRATAAATVARREGDRAAAAAKSEAAARQLAERQRIVAEQSAATVLDELEQLRKAAAAAPANSALQMQIRKADDRITQGVNALLSIRLYIHIAEEQQRDAARQLEGRVESARFGDRPVVVPGIERVGGAPPRPLLRCFVAEECTGYGLALLNIVNAALESPKVTLQDFSSTYTPDGKLRPLHFELYFPPGPIVVRQPDPKQAY